MTEKEGVRTLPVLPGANILQFRCNGCGACCRDLRVAVTHHDVRRLMSAAGRPAAELLEWLSPNEVDMTGEPGSFVELRAGRRLMVLAQTEGGWCRLLDSERRCSVYAARPLDCELFPFDLERDRAGAVVKISKLPLEACGDDVGAPAELGALSARDQQRFAELLEYKAEVARWNQIALRRRRFHHRVQEADGFLTFLGLGPAA